FGLGQVVLHQREAFGFGSTCYPHLTRRGQCNMTYSLLRRAEPKRTPSTERVSLALHPSGAPGACHGRLRCFRFVQCVLAPIRSAGRSPSAPTALGSASRKPAATGPLPNAARPPQSPSCAARCWRADRPEP